MMDITDPKAIAQTLLDCFEAQLDASDDPVCQVSLVPGVTATWDECCDGKGCGGQAWVAVQSIGPTESFPELQTVRFRCRHVRQVVRLQLGILRCSQAVTADGKPPSAERMTFETNRNLDDWQTMFTTLVCCFFPQVPEGHPWAIGEWEPLGPQGFCVGGAYPAIVSLEACTDCDTES